MNQSAGPPTLERTLRSHRLNRAGVCAIAALLGLHFTCGEIDNGDDGFCDYEYEIEIPGDSHSAGSGYTDRVKIAFPGQVNNEFAQDGTTTNDWLPGAGRIERLGRIPRVVAILLGTNDAWRTQNTPDEVVANLRRIIQYYFDLGACRIVLSTPPPWPESEPGRAERLRNIADAIHEFCLARNDDIDCGPDLNRLLGPEHMMRVGGIHMNALGHQLFAEELIPLLEVQ